VNVTAIGINNDPLSPLNVQRLQDVDLNDAPNNIPILVSDFQSLVATLLAVVVPSAIGGDLDANDSYGADGGRIFAMTVGSVTYTWDGASTIAVSSGGSIAGTSLTAVTTPMGGALTLNFATGQYNYQPPSPITVTATEAFNYVLIDRDGDKATATLSVTITAAAPPVVLDLDGDGVEFVTSAAGVHFDYAGDGVAESTAWAGADDGLLVIDKNGDGKINNGTELVFAHGSLTDLQGLAASYDSNGDGKLDPSDAAYSQFGIWRDANSNGITDAGELQSLTAAGISAISLVSDGQRYVTADGQVVVRGEATFTRADGSTGLLADASFATNFVNDAQRALTGATVGMSSAIIAAGLVAAAPLAAKTAYTALSDSQSAPSAPSDPSNQSMTHSDIERGGAPNNARYDASLGRESLPVEASVRHQAMSDHDDGRPAPPGGPDISIHAKTFAALLDHGDVEPAPIGDPRIGEGFAAPNDQSLIHLVPTPQSAELAAKMVQAIVADALEGRSLNLDALLGQESAVEHMLPQIQLQDSLADSFHAAGGMLALGSLFMPDIADQHIMAQMEHAAATGHA
jgi:hypothetical protein